MRLQGAQPSRADSKFIEREVKALLAI